MTSKKVRIIFFSFLLAILFFANFSQAALVQCGGHDEGGIKQPDCTVSYLLSTIKYIINFLLSWAWLVSILFIVVSGLRMILAGGNEETITQAKTSLNQAIVGFIIILTSFVLINLVVGLLSGAGSFDPNALMNAFNLVP